MKRLLVYALLFCLTFLNVPRVLFHDCDHHTTENEQLTTDIDGPGFTADDCFICDFDLGFFQVTAYHPLAFSAFFPESITPEIKTGVCASLCEIPVHRGPPSIV